MPSPFAAEAAACRVAQGAWGGLAVRDRLAPVRELRHLLVERLDDLLAAVEADVARPPVEEVSTDLLPTAAALKFLEREAARLLRPRRVPQRQRPLWLWGCRDAVHRRPWGVVAVVGTWNYPVFLNAVQMTQALVAGNGVLWKPSEQTPRTAEVLIDLFHRAGFPRDVVQCLPATREAGPLLAEAAVDFVAFTGSDAVGRALAARLGQRLVPSLLELSGCDALLVLADADLDAAARAAWFGATLNRGQTCIAVRRAFVARERYAAFAAKLEALAANAAEAGPVRLQTPAQQAQADRLVQDAVAKGARLVGHTFLLDARPDMAVCREAYFAPLAAVVPFDASDDAAAMANAGPYALGASIFTADVRAAEALAARLAAGSVTVNDAIATTAHPATPFGGRGASGWGVAQGAEGLLAMTVPQTVTVRGGRFRPHVDEAVSPDPATADVVRGLFRATHARGWRDRLGGVRQLLRGIRNRK